MGRVTRRHAVLRVAPGEAIRRSDTLAVEEPLEIRLNGESCWSPCEPRQRRRPGTRAALQRADHHRPVRHRARALLRRLRPRRGQQLQRLGRDPGAADLRGSSDSTQRHDDQRVRYLRHYLHRPGTARVAVPEDPARKLPLSWFSRRRNGCGNISERSTRRVGCMRPGCSA